jgi:hypothetical protein
MRHGIAPYRNASEELGLSRGGRNWQPRLADFDNSSVLQVMQAAGATKGTVSIWPLLQETALMSDQLTKHAQFWHSWHPGDDIGGANHNPFFVRAKDGRYYDLAEKIGLGEPMNNRGIATADVDGDGLLDFALANQWEPSYFFRNLAPKPGAFLGLNLRLPLARKAPEATTVQPGRPPLDKEKPTRPASVLLPDIGFIAWPDILAFAQRLRGILPTHHLLVDIDDGYCDTEIACHVVSALDSLGAFGVILEDQKRPRKCGHFEGKQILELDEYLVKSRRVLKVKGDLFVVARTHSSDPADIRRRVKAFVVRRHWLAEDLGKLDA